MMSDTNNQLDQIKGMLMGIEITILGIALGGGGVIFNLFLPVLIGCLIVLFGALRTAVAVAG